MKKILTLLLLIMVLSVTACTKKQEITDMPQMENQQETKPEENVPPKETNEEQNDRNLVIFFSRNGDQYSVGKIEEGNTFKVAMAISEALNADKMEIVPVEDKYQLPYDELTDLARQEQSQGARPEYSKEYMQPLEDYGNIFIGSPVWWTDWPMIMYTFFEENASVLAEKNIYIFNTHADSGPCEFDRKLIETLVSRAGVSEENLKVSSDILSLEGTIAQNEPETVKSEVTAWLERIHQ